MMNKLSFPNNFCNAEAAGLRASICSKQLQISLLVAQILDKVTQNVLKLPNNRDNEDQCRNSPPSQKADFPKQTNDFRKFSMK
jgi:hypothetical protein